MTDAVRAPRKPSPTISRPLLGRAARIDSAQISFVATLPAWRLRVSASTNLAVAGAGLCAG
jgi:hypothetical protein